MFVLIIFFLLEIPVLGEGGRICRRVPYKDGYVSYWPSGDGEMAVQKKRIMRASPEFRFRYSSYPSPKFRWQIIPGNVGISFVGVIVREA